MAMYFSNTGLEVLLDGDQIDEKQMQIWAQEATVTEIEGGAYYTKRLDSGLLIIYRVFEEQLVGLDMHMSGRSIWEAKPLMQVGEQEPLSLTVLLTNRSESASFIATLVHAATIGAISDEHFIEMQVCGFVQALDLYDSRASYEVATPTEMQIADQKLLPYNFIMSRESAISEADRARFKTGETLILLAGEVIASEEREHGFKETKAQVVTVKTEMGHLDLVISEAQLGKPISKGEYLTAQCVISADVLLA